MGTSTKRFGFFWIFFIYFALTYVYASSLMLSSENMHVTRPC